MIGGGFGGLLAGARLREAGIDDVRIIEKGGDFGGTWYWNRYPGAMCDVESYIYLPLLEELGYVPTEKYARAPEILAHSQRDRPQVRPLPRRAASRPKSPRCAGTRTARAGSSRPTAATACGRASSCMSNGPLNRPKLPGHPGHRVVRGPLVPHQPLGLRVHRRRFERQPDGPARQARRHHRHRRDGGAVRAASRRGGRASLRLPAHAVVDRRARQPPDRPGVGAAA